MERLILANGCQKSGTHALMAWLEALGLKKADGIVKPNRVEVGKGDFVHAHFPYDPEVARTYRVITIIRDPRNVLVSYVRWIGKDLTLSGALHDFMGKKFVPHYRNFLKWRGNCTVIYYENLTAPRTGKTYTGKPSDWKEWWNKDMDRAWNRVGGPQLVKEAGYK